MFRTHLASRLAHHRDALHDRANLLHESLRRHHDSIASHLVGARYTLNGGAGLTLPDANVLLPAAGALGVLVLVVIVYRQTRAVYRRRALKHSWVRMRGREARREGAETYADAESEVGVATRGDGGKHVRFAGLGLGGGGGGQYSRVSASADEEHGRAVEVEEQEARYMRELIS